MLRWQNASEGSRRERASWWSYGYDYDLFDNINNNNIDNIYVFCFFSICMH